MLFLLIQKVDSKNVGFVTAPYHSLTVTVPHRNRTVTVPHRNRTRIEPLRYNTDTIRSFCFTVSVWYYHATLHTGSRP